MQKYRVKSEDVQVRVGCMGFPTMRVALRMQR